MILNLLTKQQPELEKKLTDLKEIESTENYSKIHELLLKINSFRPSQTEADVALTEYKAIIRDAEKYFHSDYPIVEIKDFIQHDETVDDVTKIKYLSQIELLEDYDFGIQCWNISMFIINDMIEDENEKQELINDIKENPNKYKTGLANFEEGVANWEKLKEKIGLQEIVQQEQRKQEEKFDEDINPIVDALTKTDLNFKDIEDDFQYDDNTVYTSTEEENLSTNQNNVERHTKNIDKPLKKNKGTIKTNDILINNFRIAVDYRNKIDDIAGYIAVRTNETMESNKDYSRFAIPLNKFIIEDGEKIIKNYQKYEEILGDISKNEIKNVIKLSKDDIDKHEMGFIDSTKVNTYEEFTKRYKSKQEKEVG